MSLNIIQDSPNKYHFLSKDNNRVDIEHKTGYPCVTMWKWGTETYLYLGIPLLNDPQYIFENNKLKWDSPEFILTLYPFDVHSSLDYGDTIDANQCRQGGLEYEIIIKSRPVSNELVLPIEFKNLTFHYQPALTQEEKDNGNIRPKNVEGSYAVYHATKTSSIYVNGEGEKYNGGKAFHIYVPLVEDNVGNKIWASIHISEVAKTLTISIDGDWLDNAEYPVRVWGYGGAKIGYETQGGSWSLIAVGLPGENRKGSAWTIGATAGTCDYIKAYLKGDQTTDVKAFVNEEDTIGNTHDQIATKENLACATAEHWETFTLNNEDVSASTSYILNVIGNDDNLSGVESYWVAFDTNGANNSYAEAGDYSNPESPWGIVPETTKDYSIWLNYTTAATTAETDQLAKALPRFTTYKDQLGKILPRFIGYSD